MSNCFLLVVFHVSGTDFESIRTLQDIRKSEREECAGDGALLSGKER